MKRKISPLKKTIDAIKIDSSNLTINQCFKKMKMIIDEKIKKIKKNNQHGILFWITGLSGSGKTRIAKKIAPKIRKKYGSTVVLSGDDIRNIFNLKGYSFEERKKTVMKYCKLAKKITSQKVNVILAVIGMVDELRDWNMKNQKNYKIYI